MLHATCVPLHASCYPTPTLGNVCDEGAEVCVEVVGGGGWRGRRVADAVEDRTIVSRYVR